MTDSQPPVAHHVSVTVVKAGGTQGVDFGAVCRDAAELIAQGRRLLLVHGGSAEANSLGEALDYPARFITSPSGYTSRYSDRRTMEIFIMAVNGKVNSLLVEGLQTLDVNAIGLSGLDGRILVARRKAAIRSVERGKQKVIRDDYSGKIKTVNDDLLKTLLADGYTPVIAPLAISTEGQALNVDADRAAAMVAGAMGAETLVLLTAVPGLMSAFPDESTLIHSMSKSQLEEAKEYAQGRMKKKILGTEEALGTGVRKVIIADGRIENPITSALNGSGTHIS